MNSLLPIIARSIIGNNEFIITYYWPEQLGDERRPLTAGGPPRPSNTDSRLPTAVSWTTTSTSQSLVSGQHPDCDDAAWGDRLRPAWSLPSRPRPQEQPGLVRTEPPQDSRTTWRWRPSWSFPCTWTRQVRQRFACFVLMLCLHQVCKSMFSCIQTLCLDQLGLDFGPNFMLDWTICTKFAIGFRKISWGNLMVLKQTNQLQTLTKPFKQKVNYKQSITTCLDLANQFIKMQTHFSRCKSWWTWL